MNFPLMKASKSVPMQLSANNNDNTANSKFLHPQKSLHKVYESDVSVQSDCSFATPITQNMIDDVPILKVRKLRNIKRLHQAMRTYHQRLAKPLDFNPKYIICDNIEEICDIIKSMTHILSSFKWHGMPFQIDLMIFPKNTKNTIDDTLDDTDDDDDDDDDDEDDMKSDEFDELDDDRPDADYDHPMLGDMVDSNKPRQKKDEYDIGDMLMSMNKKHYDHFYENCIPFDRSDDGIKALQRFIKRKCIKPFKKSTQNGRYVFIVDRDGNHSQSFISKNKVYDVSLPQNEQKTDYKAAKGKDYLYCFQPPKEYGHCIDHETMIEVLHLNTLDCLLPKTKNNDDDENEEFVGAKHFEKGEMLCVSFHILSDDEIRCYLYIDQKYMRINIGQNCYLQEILKKYFQQQPSNEKTFKQRENYNDFGISTNDPAFEDYFEWVHKRVYK